MEQKVNKHAARPPRLTEKDRTMTELKDVIARNSSTLAQDFAGAAALVVIVFTGLSLPGLL